MSDRGWFYFAVFARSVATGMIGVLRSIYLSVLDLGADSTGIVVGVGLGGAAFATALLSFFFHERFGVGVESIALVFVLARIANAASHIGAAWMCRRGSLT